MNFWDKKFKQMLAASEENEALKARVGALETQLAQLATALGQVMKGYVDLGKITMDNRKGLEEVYAYLTAEGAHEEHGNDPLLSDEAEMSEEELIARRRLLN